MANWHWWASVMSRSKRGGHDVAGGLWCLAEFEDEVTAVLVVDFKEVNTFVDTDEWSSVGWQD